MSTRQTTFSILSRRALLGGMVAGLIGEPGRARAECSVVRTRESCPSRWTYATARRAAIPLPDGPEGEELRRWCAFALRAFEMKAELIMLSCKDEISSHYDSDSKSSDYILVSKPEIDKMHHRYSDPGAIIQGILGHECWHLAQYHDGVVTITSRHELEADAMAGYVLGLLKRDIDFNVNGTIRWLEVRTPPDCPGHGTAEQRHACLLWGFEYGYREGPQPLTALRSIARTLSFSA
ncbi:hypothetical protein [Phaeospirillum tilakii]|uniref:Uncharacterized protein n=1 Tax=Phaeospirillum tilakii TaxID=741673 RepID=A0ABW5C7X1_9PROT